MNSLAWMRCNAVALTLACSAVLASPSAAAQQHPCAATREAAARLACYDRAFPPAEGSSTELVDVEAQRELARKQFGLSGQQRRESDPGVEAVEVGRVQARVTRIAVTAEGERVVTLDNDQSWRLIEDRANGRIEIGDTVVVRKAALGSFMLVTPHGLALRARRTR